MCTYINRIIIEYVVGCGPDAISCDLLLLLSHSTIRYDNTAVRFFDLIIASSSSFLFSHDYKQFYDKLYRNVRGLRRQITKQRLLCAFETTNKFLFSLLSSEVLSFAGQFLSFRLCAPFVSSFYYGKIFIDLLLRALFR